MAYRRQWKPRDYNTGPTKVTVHWSMKASAYAIKFLDTRHWNEMQIFITYLKGIPYGERDYNPDEKIWYLMEKHIDPFREMLKHMNQYFQEDFQGKAENQAFVGTFVSIDTYLDKFKELTGTDIRTCADYNMAKKIYRRAALENHPDRNNGDGSKMSDINEAWSQIEKLHFSVKKEPEYVS